MISASRRTLFDTFESLEGDTSVTVNECKWHFGTERRDACSVRFVSVFGPVDRCDSSLNDIVGILGSLVVAVLGLLTLRS